MRHDPHHHQFARQAHPRPPKIRRRRGTHGTPIPRKSRKEEIRNRRGLVLLTLCGILGLEVAAAVLTSPLLGIRRIQVRGAEVLPSDEAEATSRAIALPAGTNLLRAPLKQMESRLKALPWMRTAQVTWAFPHGLNVRLTPRDPVILAQLGPRRFEVDSEGVPIRPARETMAGRLPLVVMQHPYEVLPGSPLQAEGLLPAIEIYRDARQQAMVRIAKIEVDQNGNLCLNMQDGIRIQIGQADELMAKMQLVRRIYEQDPDVSRRMVAINLSYPRQPACTPRPLTPAGLGSQTASPSPMSPASTKPDGDSSL